MYAEGHGVPQDYVEAYKWLTLAASRSPDSEKESRDLAAKSRDLLATKMTPAQIEEAEKLAHEWVAK
jgi:TPR repeat protein